MSDKKKHIKKVNKMSLDMLERKLYELKHKTFNDKKGVTHNCPQDNSKFAEHIIKRIKVLKGELR